MIKKNLYPVVFLVLSCVLGEVHALPTWTGAWSLQTVVPAEIVTANNPQVDALELNLNEIPVAVPVVPHEVPEPTARLTPCFVTVGVLSVGLAIVFVCIKKGTTYTYMAGGFVGLAFVCSLLACCELCCDR